MEGIIIIKDMIDKGKGFAGFLSDQVAKLSSLSIFPFILVDEMTQEVDSRTRSTSPHVQSGTETPFTEVSENVSLLTSTMKFGNEPNSQFVRRAIPQMMWRLLELPAELLVVTIHQRSFGRLS